MSAIPPKADIAKRRWNVRLVPIADIAHHFGCIGNYCSLFSSIGAAGGAEIPLVSSKDTIGRHVKLVDASETIRACQRPYNVSLLD